MVPTSAGEPGGSGAAALAIEPGGGCSGSGGLGGLGDADACEAEAGERGESKAEFGLWCGEAPTGDPMLERLGLP